MNEPMVLPDFRLMEEAAFLKKFEFRELALDQAKHDLEAARLQITQLETETEGLRSHIATMESRVRSCVLERDAAIADRVARETSLVAIGGHLEAIYSLLRHVGVDTHVEEPAGG